ncbi:hypothetical protein C9374_006054 [Naegleria lovaniensis]|uniref:PH domain-containing protein n=1 Tax=Naegleria lovaniensis TaxID=51637 RepID=A0AA88GK80_NAELO|nr:uncharacterized protein C9374_006054 [Naegleria lovaniensis]KAG2381670.1 hypothetical protein C9374_006054 [Naegleria lovaniensis]
MDNESFVRFEDNESGKVYYYPRGKSFADTSFLYLECFDQEKQKKYYLNQAYGKILWELPVMDFEKVEKETAELLQQQAQQRSATTSSSSATNALPSTTSSASTSRTSIDKNTRTSMDKADSVTSKQESSPKTPTTPSTPAQEERKSLDKKNDSTPPTLHKEKSNFKAGLKSIFSQKSFISRASFSTGNNNEAVSRASFSSSASNEGVSRGSFSGETDSEVGDDDFSDFATANIAQPVTATDSKPKMKFERVTSEAVLGVTPTTIEKPKAQTMRGTLFLKRDSIIEIENSGPVKQKRGELEASIESSLFTGVGMGNVKVLAAVEGILAGSSSKKKDKKDNIIMAVARDWCGSYMVATISNMRTGLSFSGNARSITKTYSLADNFNIKTLEPGSTVKFELSIDGEKEVDEDILNMRLASVEFAESTCPTTYSTEDVQSLVSLTFDSKKIIPEDVVTLRAMIRKSPNRKALLQALHQRLENTSATDEKEISLILELFNEAIICPVKCEGGLEQKIKDRLLSLRGMMKDGDVAEKVDLVIEQIQILISVLENWQGRGKLPDVPFPPEFLGGPTSDIGKKKMEKQSQQIKENISKYFNGVFLSVIYYTDTHILMDSSNMLPSEKLRFPYASIPTVSMDSPDFQWLLDLGKNWSELISNYDDPPENVFPSIKLDMIRAGKKLRSTFNISLGVLYDRVVDVKETKVAMLLACKYLEDRSLITHPNYVWEERTVFEHRLYQGLGILSHYNERIERLSDTFYGPRFIENVITFSKQMTSTKILEDGVYLGYLRWCWSSKNDFRLLLDENKRMMIPHVRITKGALDKEKLEWMQTIRARSAIGQPIEADYQHQVTLEVPIDQYEKFEHKFYRAILELKSSLGIDGLGYLYDLESITLDPNNKIYLIVYCDQSDEDDLRDNWSGKYIWRSLRSFENIHTYCFWEHVTSLYKSNVNKIVCSGVEPDGSTTDEIGRGLSSNEKQNALTRAHKAFFPFRWPSRILNWAMKGYVSFINVSTPSTSESILQLIKETTKNLSNTNFELKNSINELSQKYSITDATSWELIYSVVSKKDKNKKNVKIATDDKDKQITKAPTVEQAMEAVPVQEFELSCNFKSFIDIESAVMPTSIDVCTNIVNEIVDLALVEAIDWKEYQVSVDVLEEMISIIETLEMISSSVTISYEAESFVDLIKQERDEFQFDFIHKFEAIIQSSESTQKTKKTALDICNASYDSIIRSCVSLFNDSIENAMSMLNAASSGQDTFELLMEMETYDEACQEKQAIISQCSGSDEHLNTIKNLYLHEDSYWHGTLNEDVISSMISESKNEYNRQDEALRKLIDKLHSSPHKKPTSSEIPTISIPAIMQSLENNVSPKSKKLQPSLTLLSLGQEKKISFPIHAVESNNRHVRKFLHQAVLGVFSLEYTSDVVAILANYLQAKNVRTFLMDLQIMIDNDKINIKKLSQLSRQYDIPEMYILCTRALNFDLHSLTIELTKPYLVRYSLSTWANWEKDLSFLPDCDKLFDIMYYIRFKVDLDTLLGHGTPYSLKENTWKQCYAEQRITFVLKDSITYLEKFYPKTYWDEYYPADNSIYEGNIDINDHFKTELTIWKIIGKHIRKLNLKNLGSLITDRELLIISKCCPLIEEINLKNCSITKDGIKKFIASLGNPQTLSIKTKFW